MKLVQKSVGDQMLEKIVECLKAYREACIEQKSAAFYNKFIAEIKKDFATEKKTLWAQVIVESLGLVTVMEEASSNVNTDEAKDFLAEEKATASAPTDEGDDANEEDLVIIILLYFHAECHFVFKCDSCSLCSLMNCDLDELVSCDF